METSIRYGGDSKSIRIHAKEKIPISANSICQLKGELDTKLGAPTFLNGTIRYFHPELAASVGVGVQYNRRDKVHYHMREPSIHADQNAAAAASPLPISRRSAILISVLPFCIVALPQPLLARERRSRKTIPIEDYLSTPDGLKYYDLIEGKGPVAEKGSTVQVHFDCLYRGITAVSSRESKLLAGNRSIAQPYVFQVGAVPGKERKREFVDSPNGLFSAQAAPKPPKAMYTVTEGMKVGGKRTVIVPPEAGYGPKGMNEIPPGAEFELNIELLEVLPSEGK